jgi:hypothetical protein
MMKALRYKAGKCFGGERFENKTNEICSKLWGGWADGRRTGTYRRDITSGWNCASCEDASYCWCCQRHPLRCAAAGSTSDQYSSDCDDPLSRPLVGDQHTWLCHWQSLQICATLFLNTHHFDLAIISTITNLHLWSVSILHNTTNLSPGISNTIYCNPVRQIHILLKTITWRWTNSK